MLIIHVFAMLVTLILFFLCNCVRIKSRLNHNLVDLIAHLTRHLNKGKPLHHAGCEISEIGYLIGQINHWKYQREQIKNMEKGAEIGSIL